MKTQIRNFIATVLILGLFTVLPIFFVLATPFRWFRRACKTLPEGMRWPTFNEQVAQSFRDLADILDDTRRIEVTFK